MLRYARIFLSYLCLILASCQSPADTSVPPSYTARLEELVDQYPDSLLLREQLIQCYRDSGQLTEALRVTDECLRGDSLQVRFWHIRGVLAYEGGDTTAAEQAFRTALQLGGQPAEAIYLARLLAEEGRAESLAICDSLDRSGYRLPQETWLVRAVFHDVKGATDSALRCLDRSIASQLTYTEGYELKADILASLKRFSEALAVLRQATTLQNQYLEGYRQMGEIYEQMDQDDSARLCYERLLLYAPGDPGALQALKRMGLTSP